MVQNAINNKNVFIQRVSTAITGFTDVSATIPFDDSIPQSGEGTEIVTLAITPKFTTSNLLIRFQGSFVKSTAGSAIFGLFQDSTADALTAKAYAIGSAVSTWVDIQYIMSSGTTSATTFKIRCGPAANNLYVNGSLLSAGAIYGGVSNTTLTILEYL